MLFTWVSTLVVVLLGWHWHRPVSASVWTLVPEKSHCSDWSSDGSFKGIIRGRLENFFFLGISWYNTYIALRIMITLQNDEVSR